MKRAVATSRRFDIGKRYALIVGAEAWPPGTFHLGVEVEVQRRDMELGIHLGFARLELIAWRRA